MKVGLREQLEELLASALVYSLPEELAIRAEEERLGNAQNMKFVVDLVSWIKKDGRVVVGF